MQIKNDTSWLPVVLCYGIVSFHYWLVSPASSGGAIVMPCALLLLQNKMIINSTNDANPVPLLTFSTSTIDQQPGELVFH